MSSLKLKKRWFVLTHNSLDYYKSSEKNALKLGTLVLNSLCSVVPPDEKIFKETGEESEGMSVPPHAPACPPSSSRLANAPSGAPRGSSVHTGGQRGTEGLPPCAAWMLPGPCRLWAQGSQPGTGRALTRPPEAKPWVPGGS